MLRLLVFFLGLTPFAASLFSQQTFLVIKPEGHTSSLREVIVTADKKTVISCADDKSVKIWDIETGAVIDELLGDIGTGLSGTVYAMALSPDEKWLAVSGLMCNDENQADCGDIRLYDFRQKKLVALLSSHLNTVAALSFSPDSRYLVSGGIDTYLKVWDVESKEMIYSLEGHSDDIYDIKCWKNFAVSASIDGTIRVWDIIKGIQLYQSGKTDMADCVAISPDHRFIAAGDRSNRLFIFDSTLKLLQKIENGVAPTALSFSPDSKKLIAGSYIYTQDQQCNLFQLNSKDKWEKTHSYTDHHWFVAGVTFYDNNTVITAGGHENKIDFWEPLPGGEIRLLRSLKGVGSPFWAVSKAEEYTAFTKNRTEGQGRSKLEWIFNMLTGEIYEIPDEGRKYLPLPVFRQGNWTLSHSQGGAYNYEEGVLDIMRNKKEMSEIVKGMDDGYVHYSYTFLEDSTILTGGANGKLSQYNREGGPIASFYGHEGQVWAVTQGYHPEWLISGSGDQTFKLWRLDKPFSQSFLPPDYLHESWIDFWRNEHPEIKIEDEKSTEKLYQALLKAGDPDANQLVYFREYKPMANIFLSNHGEWVIWCPDGYFKCSKSGSKYIGYHINNGPQKAADFYPFQQFDLKYNRPDIINERLGLGDSLYNDQIYKAYLKRLRKMGMEEKDLASDLHLPQINYKIEKVDSSSGLALINFSASDSKYELDRIYLTVNGVPFPSGNGVSVEGGVKEFTKTLEIPLSSGLNNISVSVFNMKGAESMRKAFKIVSGIRKKPDLYFISIGAGEYIDQEKNLKFAEKDAKDILELANQELGSFNNVYGKSLTGNKVIADSVLYLKKWLQKSKVDDHVIVFYAGHGLLDEEFNYYLATYNVNFAKPAENGLLYEDMESILDGIPARNKLLFIDACHSGEVDKESVVFTEEKEVEYGSVTFRSGGDKGVKYTETANIFMIMQNTFHDLRQGSGAVVISSSGGAEVALEGEKWNNGVFTYALKKGIAESEADLDKDGSINVSELQKYLSWSVSKLTSGRQIPTSRSENIENDFKINR